MNKNENNTRKKVQTFAICCCLCLVAAGVGVTYRAFDRSHMEVAEELPEEQQVTAIQTPPIEVAELERNQRSNDAAQAPKEKATPAKEKVAFIRPVAGEVLLPYSTDHAIYDPTLKQYRTNDSVSLSATKGEAVLASADGMVKEILQDEEAGNIIMIEHAQGWVTSYGQLEGAQVKEGDRVVQGQTIASVAAPTKYGAALGNHLEFSMAQNGVAKNPTEYLGKNK